MKNYFDKQYLEYTGYTEIPKIKFSKAQEEMYDFINSISPIIKNAKCGWDGVYFTVMEHPNNTELHEFMVLYSGSYGRYIPVNGNSKGCNFSVLGENLW